MRTLSSNALTEIAKRQGIEPVIIIDIQWEIGGQFYRYGDRDFPGIMGKILEVSPLDEIIRVSGNASSAEISFKLDDTDNSIKGIIDTRDVHLRTVKVYQWFSDLSVSDAFLVFEGQINSPIVWNESERTFSASVVSKLEDVEIGFAPEEGYNFDWISDEYFDKPWPLAFGEVKYLPGQLVYKIPQGQTTKPLSLPDTCSQHKLAYEQLKANTDILNIQASLLMRFNEGTIRQSAFFETDRTEDEVITFQNGITAARLQGTQQAQTQIADIQARRNAEVEKYNNDRESERDFGIQVGHVINGRNFPQGSMVSIKIDEAIFTGYFNGDNFITASAENPVKCSTPTLALVPNGGDSFVVFDEDDNSVQGFGFYTAYAVDTIDESKLSSNYKFIDAGATVEIVSDQREIYVVNIIESQVTNVYGYKGVNNIRQLVPLPSDYYKVYHKTVNSKYKVCIVELKRPLSSYDEGWSNDGIFVNLISSVGPNTSNIMKWLIETYTSYTAESTMFSTLASQLDKYPSNFAYFDRRQLLTALEEIAWQCRSRIWLDDGVFKVQYLATEPATVDNISKDDIVYGSMTMEHTQTEDIVTKLIGKWKTDYAQSDDNRTTVRYNVAKYGVHEQEYDFYIYNIASLVEKSAVFWAIRYGNTWKIAKFKTFLTKLKVETFDAVGINLPMYASADVTALVESATYDSADNTIDFNLWLPVRAGEMTAYDFSWPADAAVSVKWPKEDEQYAASTTAGSNANGGTFGVGSNRNNTVGGGSGGTSRLTFKRFPTGDDNDPSAPDSPAADADTTTSTKATNPGVPGGYTPNYEAGFENIKDYYPTQSISRIDIRTTQIVDSLNTGLAPGKLYHVLRVAGEGKTALFKDALMSDDNVSVVGQMHFRYDTNKVGDTENPLYRPSGSFLKDDDELADLEKLDNEE